MLLRRAAAPIALLAAVALAGCTAPEPDPTPTVAPLTDEPLFASEEEALAAAEEVYSTYVSTADLVLSEGGANPERLKPLVSPDLYAIQLEGFETAQKSGVRSTGTTKFQVVEIQSLDLDAFGQQVFLSAYVCRDLTDVDVVDSSGQSIVDNERIDIIPQEVRWSRDGAGNVIVERDRPWSGTNFC